MKLNATDGVVIFLLWLVLLVFFNYFPSYFPYMLVVTISYIITDRCFSFMIGQARQRTKYLNYRSNIPPRFWNPGARFFVVLAALVVSSAISEWVVSYFQNQRYDVGGYASSVYSLVIVLLVYLYFVRPVWE